MDGRKRADRAIHASLIHVMRVFTVASSTRVKRSSTMEKSKALDAAVAQIERAFGKGSIMRMGARPDGQQVDVVPTGSLGLDLALGIGGLPRGRIIEIYGPESSGKTTLALPVIAQ